MQFFRVALLVGDLQHNRPASSGDDQLVQKDIGTLQTSFVGKKAYKFNYFGMAAFENVLKIGFTASGIDGYPKPDLF